MITIILEAIIIGIIFSIIGIILFNYIKKNDKDKTPDSLILNMVIAYFMTGIIIYIFCELDNIIDYLKHN